MKPVFYKEEGLLVNKDLLEQLKAAVAMLEEKMKTIIPIQRGGTRVGFGVSKSDKMIAADNVISIARAIRSLPGW